MNTELNLYLDPNHIVERALALSALECALTMGYPHPVTPDVAIPIPLTPDHREALMASVPGAVGAVTSALAPYVAETAATDNSLWHIRLECADGAAAGCHEALVRHLEEAAALHALTQASIRYRYLQTDLEMALAGALRLLTARPGSDLRLPPVM